MGSFRKLDSRIDGLIAIEPEMIGDARGFFCETYRANDYAELGIGGAFVQDNHSRSGRGTLRGLHMQVTAPQAKLVRVIAGELFGQEALDQVIVDKLLLEVDGTPNKSKLGANATLGVSLAVARAAARSVGLPLYRYLGGTNAKVLPVPLMNIMNGGAHSDAPIDFQEFMIVPKNFDTFAEALRAGAEVFHSLKKVLKAKGLQTAVGDEGGFAPNLASTTDALDAIAEAVKGAGYKLGKDIFLALDVASSEFYVKESKTYVFKKSDKRSFTGDQFVSYYKDLCAKYPIVSIEDGCAENDWATWKKLTDAIGDKVQLVGDDLFVTNVEFLKKGIATGTANSILVKVNQIGTLTETLDSIEPAHKNKYPNTLPHPPGQPEVVLTPEEPDKISRIGRTEQLVHPRQHRAGVIVLYDLDVTRHRRAPSAMSAGPAPPNAASPPPVS